MHWISISVALAFGGVALVQGQGDVSSAPIPAADNPLAANLWDVAVLRIQRELKNEALSDAERQELMIRQVEALVHLGRSADALERLAAPGIDQHPEARYWQAQAIAGQGRFREAVELLADYAEETTRPWQAEAAITRANLSLSLGEREQAVASLDQFIKQFPKSPLLTEARLRKAAMLLDAGLAERAQQVFAANEALKLDSPFAQLVHARLLFAEGKLDQAKPIFTTLVQSPQGLTASQQQTAVLGLADTEHALGDSDAANGTLLGFVGEHPTASLLHAMFQRLIAWLPEQPSAAHPVMSRLQDWTAPSAQPSTGGVAIGNGAASAWPVATEFPELTAFALYARAIGLHRAGSASQLAEANRLLRRLQVEYPDHFLTQRSYLERAKWLMEEDPIAASTLLVLVQNHARSPQLQGEAAFLEAETLAKSGDENAEEMFDRAAELLEGKASELAEFNAAVTRLREGGESQLPPDLDSLDSLRADLSLERALMRSDPSGKRAALDRFLTQYPKHQRAQEARLALADAALTETPPDVSMATAQLDTLKEVTNFDDPDLVTRVALIRLRIADLQDDESEVQQLAKELIEKFPESSEAVDAEWILGRSLFLSGNYNEARLTMARLAEKTDSPPRAQAAWLIAARSAALGATTQSREEALALFDQAIAAKGTLQAAAMLEKARLMIDLNQLQPAASFLREWIEGLAQEDPLRLPAGLLLGEAIYAQGGSSPKALEEALAIYDGLLLQAESQPALMHRLQYWRGMTLELLPTADDPSRTREAEALEAYYSVLENAGTTPPDEWEWFERCGFRALALLERAERWKAAIAVARKMASFGGPGAEDAANYANQLQLKHMIWED